MNLRPLAGILFTFGIVAGVLSQNLPPSSDTETTLYVQVLGSDDSLVTTLAKDDFTILRDGKPISMSGFDTMETPLHILLLLDRTESGENHWPTMGPAIQQVFTALRPAKDQIAIGAFFDKPRMLLDWVGVSAGPPQNGTIDSIRRQLSVFSQGSPLPLGPDGASPPIIALPTPDLNPPEKDLYGALTWAIAQSRKVSGRKAVIVYTDSYQPRAEKRLSGNGQTAIVNSEKDGEFQKVLRTVVGGEVPFYFLTADTDLNPPGAFPYPFDAGRFTDGLKDRNGPALLILPDLMQIRSRIEQLAHGSGGEAVYPKRLEDVGGLWERIVRELGTSYRLSFRSSGLAETLNNGKIEVRMRRERLRVRRTGAVLAP